MILILMGVAGSGKTTVGRLLAAATAWQFAEGDDFHSASNQSKMSRAIPLSDQDRAPWLAKLHDLLLDWYESGTSGILACSALKQEYRDTLSKDIPPVSIHFIWLDVPLEVLKQRLKERKNGFLNPELLGSQLDTLEIPKDAIHIRAEGKPSALVDEILDKLLAEEGRQISPEGFGS